MQQKIRQVIATNHLFEGLRPNLIDEIASSATRRTVGAGEILFQKGDPADALWGVLSGRIVIDVGSDDGKEMVLDAFAEGDVFGEVGVLDFGPRRVEARATQQSELFRLERKHFLRYLQNSPELCFRVFTLLCSHLRETTENLEDTALYKLPNRLAKRLTLLASDSAAKDGAVLHISQSDLASMLGVNREAVNRHLRAFEKDGLIVLGRQKIEIVDQLALAGLASPGQINRHDGWGNENLSTLEPRAFTFSQRHKDASTRQGPYSAGLLAIDAAEYSQALMTDAAGTLKRINRGLSTVNRAIEQYQGHTIWHTGDRVLAEFPDAQLAMHAALAIQEQVNPTDHTDKRTGQHTGKSKPVSLFRIGVHFGEVLAGETSFLGRAVDTVIRLTPFAGAGGIAMSGAVRDALENREQLELQFLGDHELKNVTETVPVYSARSFSVFRMLARRVETFVPRRFRPKAVAVAVIVLLAVFWFSGDRMGRNKVPPAVSQFSIAVLPFTSSDDPSLSYLATGVPDEVRATLSRIPGVRVIGRESSNYFEDSKTDSSEIIRKLKVAWLLQGKLTNTDDGIQATAKLLNAVNNKVVWEEQFQSSMEDPTPLGPDIVQSVVASLGVSAGDRASLPRLLPMTSNVDAHALYLEAQNHIWHNRQRYVIRAVPLLQTAIELDPAFAEAHAVLAGLYLTQDLLDDQPLYIPGLRQELARRSLQKAIALKPDSPLVLAEASMARYLENDYKGALALSERALRIDPNNSNALWARYFVQMDQQNWVGALQTSERIIRLEPMSVQAMQARWYQLNNADRHREALAVASRTLALHPESEVPQAHDWAATSQLKMGDRLGAIDSSRKGMPYSFIDLWTGLEYDWEFFDEIAVVRPAVGLVYDKEYDKARQVLINAYDGVELHSGLTNFRSFLNIRDYLVNRGVLEALAGEFDSSIEFFERARLMVPDEDGGLVRADIVFPALDLPRQSHFSLALLFAYRQSGQHEKADLLARQIVASVTAHIDALAKVSDLADLRYLYQQAQFYAIEGRSNEALEKLRAWVDYGVDIFTYIKWDPFLNSLCGNPEYEAIVAGVEAELAGIRALYYSRQAEFAEASNG
jgi:CRP-like cAMP-binding protein/TolB-like protein/class 3 adenylate cyclase/tetratricopeptide (TPR) repeat protein